MPAINPRRLCFALGCALALLSVLFFQWRRAQARLSTPTASEVVIHPTERSYPRRQTENFGRRGSATFPVVSVQIRTVAEAAQVYADLVHCDVLVDRTDLARPLPMLALLKAVAVSIEQPSASLETYLMSDGVGVVPLGVGSVRFRVGPSLQERAKAMMPAPATPVEIAAARAAMDIDRFWDLIEAARTGNTDDCGEIAARLAVALRRLKPEEILGFDLVFRERLAESYRWDLWAIAFIVNGGASDDGFVYFQGWLIAQGRAYFEAALKEPQRAAARAKPHQKNECEEIGATAFSAYEAKTGRFPPGIPDHPGEKPGESKPPSGEKWKEEDLPRMFPDLVRRFR